MCYKCYLIAKYIKAELRFEYKDKSKKIVKHSIIALATQVFNMFLQIKICDLCYSNLNYEYIVKCYKKSLIIPYICLSLYFMKN